MTVKNLRIMSLLLTLTLTQLVDLTFTIPQAFGMTLDDQTLVYDSYAAERIGDIPKAVAKMVAILQNNPTDYFVHLRLGWLFYIQKKYKNSIDHYSGAFNATPSSIESLLGLSLVYYSTASYDKAAKACSLLLQRDPKNHTGLQRIITSQIQLRDFVHALENSNTATELYPTDPVFLEQKAYLLKETGKPEEAKATLAILLLVSPQNAYARAQATAK